MTAIALRATAAKLRIPPLTRGDAALRKPISPKRIPAPAAINATNSFPFAEK